ncbi:unnamed protein product [Rotaria sordida]|uniref:Uncharacterized protein n=2 Tax=Rotaria sordida TaxID=392033 RepID=A0A819CCV9_9BILA|nr:unnamed protein product [Rotaria sordida]CAF0878148.1 unnamed protein product [Rotaria sordida]CAF3763551.1 unnamed protein product [Rotaria sordida]CAF3816286.1 unnamed protein product [Rotaria sordida]
MSVTNTLFTLLCLVMMINGEPILRINQRSIADEPLDSIDRNNYHNLIQSIWVGVVHSTPSLINYQCVDIVNTVLDNVIECSKRLAMTQELIEELFPLLKPIKMTKKIFKLYKELVEEWMEVNHYVDTYQVCLNTAKLKWRSPIEIVLLDL